MAAVQAHASSLHSPTDASVLHGLLQTSSLVEIDLSGNSIPELLQPQLQVHQETHDLSTNSTRTT